MAGIRGDVHVRCHANGDQRGGFNGQWFRRLTSSRRACLPGRRRPSSRPSPWTLSTLAPTRSRRESKEKVESGNALPARGATRLVSSAPATSQTRARCELVDPRENDDRQSSTQQCPPTLRATGLFPNQRTAFAASLSLRLVGRKSRTYFSSNLCLFEPSFGRSISHIISRMWANLALGRKRGKF